MIRLTCWAVFVAALSLAGQARADTWGLHLASWHTAEGYNNRNPGAYWRSPEGWTVGAYCNSESRAPRFREAAACQVSAYAGRVLDAAIVGDLRAGVMVGAVTGYRRAAILPAAIGTLSYGPARLWVAPPIGNGAGVLSLSVELSF